MHGPYPHQGERTGGLLRADGIRPQMHLAASEFRSRWVEIEPALEWVQQRAVDASDRPQTAAQVRALQDFRVRLGRSRRRRRTRSPAPSSATADTWPCMETSLSRKNGARYFECVDRVEAQIPPNRAVLVVDDDADVREGLVDLIQETGRDAFGAASGAEALGLLETLPRPCLILLDIMMPGMTGFEFLEVIQKRPDSAEFPVLLISASSAIERARYYTAVLGALRKPIELRDLRAALDKSY